MQTVLTSMNQTLMSKYIKSVTDVQWTQYIFEIQPYYYYVKTNILISKQEKDKCVDSDPQKNSVEELA